MKHKLFLAAGLIFFTVAFGTTGYMVIEGWDFLDSIYMTITTLTTVGYREIHDLSTAGMIFTLILIIFGVGTVLYALSTGAKVILEGELRELFGRKRLEKKIKGIRDHYIVCGFGRMGRIICRELRAEKAHFVVIEKNPSEVVGDESTLMIIGDATSDDVLKDAGIERAKG
jgi:voltage-gated potassium channel